MSACTTSWTLRVNGARLMISQGENRAPGKFDNLPYVK
jgi:hypothetical protein